MKRKKLIISRKNLKQKLHRLYISYQIIYIDIIKRKLYKSKQRVYISALNNLEVVTTTSDKYSDIFGFTEMEVFQALDEYGLSDNKKNVKRWYDGFIFGSCKDIYNPWSILNYLDKREYGTYWANTSANSLVGRLIRESNRDIKQKFEDLLNDKSIWCEIDEQNFAGNIQFL